VFPEILQSIHERPLTDEERKKLAVQVAEELFLLSERFQTPARRKLQKELAALIDSKKGLHFLTAFTDQACRSADPDFFIQKLQKLLHQYGVPPLPSPLSRLGFWVAKVAPRSLLRPFAPLLRKEFRKRNEQLLYYSDSEKLEKMLKERREKGVQVNINRLGEEVLSDAQASSRVKEYLKDLCNPLIDYISIKISSLEHDLNLLDPEGTGERLKKSLRPLFRLAMKEKKFINLDMEAYSDLQLTLNLFSELLSEPEFHRFPAGIALQAYLPDSYTALEELIEWASARVDSGGGWIKVRLVKGANLETEQMIARLKNWYQAPYPLKADADANFKKMLDRLLNPEVAKAVRLGLGSHNLFDIALALVMSHERGVEMEFEMLEGMAPALAEALFSVVPKLVLYTPIVSPAHFENAVAYLIRRFDENSSPENFLTHYFSIDPTRPAWEEEKRRFLLSYDMAAWVSSAPRRLSPPTKATSLTAPFRNEPDSDWTLHEKVQEVHQELSKRAPTLPPSASKEEVLAAIEQGATAEGTLGDERFEKLLQVAALLRTRRAEVIACMVQDTGKVVEEADVELSEAVDYLEYYTKEMQSLLKTGILRPRGLSAVIPPWNFSLAIPIGGITAALASGCPVIIKPAPEARRVGLKIAELFHEAGFEAPVFQFIACEDGEASSQLITDPRIQRVLLTGGTETAHEFLKLRPGLDLTAETGGKNSLIVTASSDRDRAIEDLIHSAFSYGGQKCSACSLAILTKEVYEDESFLRTLKNAALSLKVGPSEDPATHIGPLIVPPSGKLLRGLTELEEGESWLLEPSQNGPLVTPGIKLGVKRGSFSHQTEFFGPLLSVMRAEDLEEAITLANAVPYGLTAGLQSLDEDEKERWCREIQAGNLYINRPITGAVVRRQPFGGIKESNFGPGFKAGGPNFLLSMVQAEDTERDELQVAANYRKVWKARFKEPSDPSALLGQKNELSYHTRENLLLRVEDELIQLQRFQRALQVTGAKAHISFAASTSFEEWLGELRETATRRVYFFTRPKEEELQALAELNKTPILLNFSGEGRFDLPYVLQERALSHDTHRFGHVIE